MKTYVLLFHFNISPVRRYVIQKPYSQRDRDTFSNVNKIRCQRCDAG